MARPARDQGRRPEPARRSDGGFEPFAPEVVTDYEVGVKADFLDHRLRVDAAGYHSDYSDVQRTVVRNGFEWVQTVTVGTIMPLRDDQMAWNWSHRASDPGR